MAQMLLGQGSELAGHPDIIRALEKIAIVLSEGEISTATAAMRHMTSTGADVYASLGSALTALSG
jgi:citrate synthase